MYMSPYATSVTREHMTSGKRIEPKMERLSRPQGYTPKSKLKASDYECSMPPRTREGKNYAGGRPLRRAMTQLGVLKANFKDRMPNAKQTKCSMPGSLKA